MSQFEIGLGLLGELNSKFLDLALGEGGSEFLDSSEALRPLPTLPVIDEKALGSNIAATYVASRRARIRLLDPVDLVRVSAVQHPRFA